MGVLTGPYAPDPPHRSSVLRWPLGVRSQNQRVVSALSSPELQARTSSMRQVVRQLGLIPVSWRKTGVANQVQAWFPGGSAVNWGDGVDNPGTDGWLTHTYAAPGLYTIDVTHSAYNAVGEARVQV